MTNFPSDSELFSGPGDPLQGYMDTEEALIELVKARFPSKPFCFVEHWTVFRVEVTDEELNTVHSAGQLPLILFAHNVLFDSQRRFDCGDWVRSTMATTFQDGFLFETRNTLYVLIGNGHEKTATLKTVLSFF